MENRGHLAVASLTADGGLVLPDNAIDAQHLVDSPEPGAGAREPEPEIPVHAELQAFIEAADAFMPASSPETARLMDGVVRVQVRQFPLIHLLHANEAVGVLVPAGPAQHVTLIPAEHGPNKLQRTRQEQLIGVQPADDVARANPLLRASVWPRSGSLTKCASRARYRSMTAMVPSVEPPSITMYSTAPDCWSRTERMAASTESA